MRQIEGLRSVRTEVVVRRLPMGGPIAFGRGVRIDLEIEDLAFQGASPFLLGCVLERYFARHVSMNGFTETRLRSAARGEILRATPADAESLLTTDFLRLEDEEVPRDGVVVQRAFNYARDANGRGLLWIGRSKKTGRGEGASGLRFDGVKR